MSYGSFTGNENDLNAIRMQCITFVSSGTSIDTISTEIYPFIDKTEAVTADIPQLKPKSTSYPLITLSDMVISNISITSRVYQRSIEDTATTDLYHASNRDQVSLLIDSLYMSINEDYTNDLVDRLRYLAEPSGDPNEDDMSYGSLAYFVRYIKSGNVLYPDIMLTPEGMIRAEWYLNNTHHFITEFKSDGLVRYMATNPSKINTNQVLRNSGTIEADSLKKIIQLYGCEAWCISGDNR